MEAEQVQKILEGYALLEQEIEQIEEESERWKSRGETVAACGAAIGRGAGVAASRVERTVEEIELINKKLIERYEALSRRRGEIEEMLQTLQNKQLALLMRFRYLEGMSWEQIAEKMNFDTSWVYRLHKKALLYISRALKYSKSS